MPANAKGRFIEPMLLLRTDALPNDADRWEYQLTFARISRRRVQQGWHGVSALAQ